jgi:hypothetical protein
VAVLFVCAGDAQAFRPLMASMPLLPKRDNIEIELGPVQYLREGSAQAPDGRDRARCRRLEHRHIGWNR